jgi:hypothetical protein
MAAIPGFPPGATSGMDMIRGGAGMGGLAAANPYLLGGAAALNVGAQVGGILAGRKRAKKQKDREERILREIESGASQAKGDIMSTLGAAQGATTQALSSRGLVNSSAAADAAGATAAGVGQQMSQVTQQAARDKAAVSSDFASMDAGGGGGYGQAAAGTGAAIGALLASNAGSGGLGQPPGAGSLTGQAADAPSPISLRGGDPGLTSDSITGAYDAAPMPAEAGQLPAAQFDVASAVKKARGARGRRPQRTAY